MAKDGEEDVRGITIPPYLISHVCLVACGVGLLYYEVRPSSRGRVSQSRSGPSDVTDHVMGTWASGTKMVIMMTTNMVVNLAVWVHEGIASSVTDCVMD